MELEQGQPARWVAGDALLGSPCLSQMAVAHPRCPPAWSCPGAGADGELLSRHVLLEDVAATAPNAHTRSQHQHSEVPGLQQKLARSAPATSTARARLPPCSQPGVPRKGPSPGCGTAWEPAREQLRSPSQQPRQKGPRRSTRAQPSGSVLSCRHRLLQQGSPCSAQPAPRVPGWHRRHGHGGRAHRQP